jgi:hypothetical protein
MRDLEIGNCQAIGRLAVPLSGFRGPGQFKLTVAIGSAHNAWDFWVYPTMEDERRTSSVVVTNVLDSSVIARLAGGATVLLSLGKGRVAEGRGGEVAVGFSSIFWNTVWTSGQAPHTLGILCRPNHPALKEFPTSYHTDVQWWELVAHASAMNLDSLDRRLEPIVRIIDDWNKNRNLALLFEAQIDGGKIVVSGADLTTDLVHRPAARQMCRSLKAYMSAPGFSPRVIVSIEKLKQMVKNPT